MAVETRTIIEVTQWQQDLLALCNDGTLWLRSNRQWKEVDVSALNPPAVEPVAPSTPAPAAAAPVS